MSSPTSPSDPGPTGHHGRPSHRQSGAGVAPSVSHHNDSGTTSADTVDSLREELALAQRRLANAQYVRQAAEALAVQAAERQTAAETRAAESDRRLARALDKIEALELANSLSKLATARASVEDTVADAEREVRLHLANPNLQYPVCTAERRALAKAEARLRRARMDLAAVTAALDGARATVARADALRAAATVGDADAIRAALELPQLQPLPHAQQAAVPGSATAAVRVNLPDATGFAPLHYACASGSASAVVALLAAGADVHDAEAGRIAPLAIASQGGHTAVVEELLSAGARVSAADGLGSTALHSAAARGHIGVMERLLVAGADPRTADAFGRTPLHAAALGLGEAAVARRAAAAADRRRAAAIAAEALEAEAMAKRTSAAAAAAMAAVAASARAGSTLASGVTATDAKESAVPAAAEGGTDVADGISSGSSGTAPAMAAGDGSDEDPGRGRAAWLLLEWGADPEARDADGVAPLGAALECGSRDVAIVIKRHLEELRGGGVVDGSGSAGAGNGGEDCGVAEATAVADAAAEAKGGADADAGGEKGGGACDTAATETQAAPPEIAAAKGGEGAAAAAAEAKWHDAKAEDVKAAG